MPTGKAIELQLDSVPDIGVLDDATLLIASAGYSFWMRWRIDGSGAGLAWSPQGASWRAVPTATAGPSSARARGQAVPPNCGTSIPMPRPARRPTAWCSSARASSNGGTRAWDIDSRTPPPGRSSPIASRGCPRTFDLIPGGLGRLAFVAFEERLVAFDPATGEAVGEPMSVPGWRVDEALSASTTPDEARVAFTWWDGERNDDRDGGVRHPDRRAPRAWAFGRRLDARHRAERAHRRRRRDGAARRARHAPSLGRVLPVRRAAARHWT